MISGRNSDRIARRLPLTLRGLDLTALYNKDNLQSKSGREASIWVPIAAVNWGFQPKNPQKNAKEIICQNGTTAIRDRQVVRTSVVCAKPRLRIMAAIFVSSESRECRRRI